MNNRHIKNQQRIEQKQLLHTIVDELNDHEKFKLAHKKLVAEKSQLEKQQRQLNMIYTAKRAQALEIGAQYTRLQVGLEKFDGKHVNWNLQHLYNKTKKDNTIQQNGHWVVLDASEWNVAHVFENPVAANLPEIASRAEPKEVYLDFHERWHRYAPRSTRELEKRIEYLQSRLLEEREKRKDMAARSQALKAEIDELIYENRLIQEDIMSDMDELWCDAYENYRDCLQKVCKVIQTKQQTKAQCRSLKKSIKSLKYVDPRRMEIGLDYGQDQRTAVINRDDHMEVNAKGEIDLHPATWNHSKCMGEQEMQRKRRAERAERTGAQASGWPTSHTVRTSQNCASPLVTKHANTVGACKSKPSRDSIDLENCFYQEDLPAVHTTRPTGDLYSRRMRAQRSYMISSS